MKEITTPRRLFGCRLPESVFARRPDIATIKDAGEGRSIAVDWQHWASEQNLSYGELANWQAFFEQIAAKFPDLTEEFKENAIC